MDYFQHNAKKLSPKGKPVERPADPLPIYERSSVEVSESSLSDTFIGRMQKFWRDRGK